MDDPGLQATVNKFIAARKLAGADLLAFKSNLDTNIQHEYAGGISQLALWFDEDSELPGGDKLVTGGFQKMVEYLGIGIDVKLNSVVKSVAYTATGVTVTASTGVFTAPRAVVTLPLGVLQARSVTFSPPLPAANTAGIAGLGSGLLSKLVLVFATPFWGTTVQIIDRIAPAGNGAWEEWISMYPAMNKAVLIGFNAASYATSLEGKSDAVVLAEAMAVLRQMYPTAPNPLTYRVTHWAGDQFSKGSYSFTTPRMEYTPAHAAVGKAVGPLQFAGEHTSMKFPGTAHGAYFSGVDAACRVLKSLAKAC